MVEGTKGIGNHKHATSGNAGHSPRFKHNRNREENERLRDEQQKAAQRKSMGLTFNSVGDAVKNNKPR